MERSGIKASVEQDTARRWSFAECEFDGWSRQLRVRGRPIPMEAKPLEVLLLLLLSHGRAVSKEEIIHAVWGYSSDESLTTAISKLRKSLGPEGMTIIGTVPKQGYRMGVQVSATSVEAGDPAQYQVTAGSSLPQREEWKLVEPLDNPASRKVWLVRHSKTRELRVVKFAMNWDGLDALRREVAVYQLLKAVPATIQSAFVKVLDHNFSKSPYWLESEYCGWNLLQWAVGDEETEGELQKTDVATRVRMMTTLASAVAAAHGLGVLHRDLKPSNVLVNRGEDGEWQVKVADFGVASLADANLLLQMDITDPGTWAEARRPGTAMYLAPEVMSGLPATTQSDIYALGVMLYQMIAGDLQTLPSPGWEIDIPDPLLRQDIADAANRDPGARIQNATTLAERLQTLEARRAQREERERLLAAAQRAEQSLAQMRLRRPWVILAIVALCSGLLASLWFDRRAEQARDAARNDAARASRMEAFTESLFTEGEDGVPEKGLPVESLLERGVRNAQTLDTDRPERAEMLHTLGKVYNAMGLFDTSNGLLLDALKEREQVFGPSSPQAAATLAELCSLRTNQGRYPEALAFAQRAYAIDLRSLPTDDPQTLRAQIRKGLATIDLGDYLTAVPLLEAVIQKERGKADQAADLSDALNDLGIAETYLGHTDEALRLNEESLAIDRRRLGNKHPDIGAGLITESQLERDRGDYARAEMDARAALDIYRGWFNPGHYEIAGAETTLGDALVPQGKGQEALPLLLDALHIYVALFPNANERTAHTLAALGTAEQELHHPDTALNYYERAAAQYRALFPSKKDYRLGLMLYHVGQTYFIEQRLSEAESALREAVQIETSQLPAEDKRLMSAQSLLEQVLRAEHRLPGS